MRDIRDLDDKQYANIMNLSRELPVLGEGAEGTCVLGVDGYAYKIYDGICDYEYDIDDIIMEDEFNLKSFAFPNLLYIHDGELCAYRMRLVYPNLFDLFADYHIDEDGLLQAIDKFITDLRVVSDKGILTFELPFNLLFTGKRLVGVDTPSYKRKNYNTFNENLDILDYALDAQYDLLSEYRKDIKKPNYSKKILTYKKK